MYDNGGGGSRNRRAGNGNVDSRARRPDVAAGACTAAATLYGPGNKYRLNVREPSRMTSDLRAREREQGDKVGDREEGGHRNFFAVGR